MSTAAVPAAVHEVIGVFSGADKMLLFFAARSGFRLVRKGFRSLAWCHTAGDGERERAETEKIGGWLSSSPLSSPPSFSLLSGAAHSYRFKFHQFIGFAEVFARVPFCLSTQNSTYIKHILRTVPLCHFNQATKSKSCTTTYSGPYPNQANFHQ